MNTTVLVDGEQIGLFKFTDDAMLIARSYENQSRYAGKVKVLWQGVFSERPRQIYPEAVSVHQCGDGSLESKLEMGGVDE